MQLNVLVVESGRMRVCVDGARAPLITSGFSIYYITLGVFPDIIIDQWRTTVRFATDVS